MSGTALVFACLFITSVARAQSGTSEEFLRPRVVTSMAEQKLLDLIKGHRPGDLADAADIQHKLGWYYTERGETTSARICEQRAEAAEAGLRALKSDSGSSTRSYSLVPMKPSGSKGTRREQPATRRPRSGQPGHRPADDAPREADRKSISQPALPPAPAAGAKGPETPPASRKSSLQGLYYAMVSGALEKWDFYENGTFLHQWVASGSGTSARSSERGEFEVTGDTLLLRVTNSASAFATPGAESHGRQTAVLGGGQEKRAEVRRMKIKLLGPHGEQGVVLDGQPFKVRSWP